MSQAPWTRTSTYTYRRVNGVLLVCCCTRVNHSFCDSDELRTTKNKTIQTAGPHERGQGGKPETALEQSASAHRFTWRRTTCVLQRQRGRTMAMQKGLPLSYAHHGRGDTPMNTALTRLTARDSCCRFKSSQCHTKVCLPFSSSLPPPPPPPPLSLFSYFCICSHSTKMRPLSPAPSPPARQ